MEIKRQYLVENLESFSGEHGLLIGDPGVGKSHVMRLFSDALDAQGAPNLYIPLDKLTAVSEEMLQKELGYKADSFCDYLKYASSTGGILLMDAFDSLRSDDKRRFYLKIASEIIGGDLPWRVLISCRTYDAEKSLALLETFPADKSEAIDSVFQCKTPVKCRHFYIPPLTDEEIVEGVDSIDGLSPIYSDADERLKNLFVSPFNLSLMEQILRREDGERLSYVRSQVELLKLFWLSRVEYPNAEGSEKVLRKLTQQMLQSMTLAIDFPDDTDEAAIHSLKSAGVLSKVGSPLRVAYAHNILFDYAVSRYCINEQGTVVTFLEEDAGRAVFMRPSLDYYFSALWHDDNEIFWTVLWTLLEHPEKTHIRLFARLIPFSVIVRECSAASELQPLFDAIGEKPQIGIEAAKRLLQSVKTLGVSDVAFWLEVYNRLTDLIAPEFVWDLSYLTLRAGEQAEKANQPDILYQSGAVSRKLLRWVWANEEDENVNKKVGVKSLGGRLLIPAVLRSAASSPAESKELLRPVLEKIKKPGLYIDYVTWLCDGVAYLFSVDAEFATEIYQAVFSHAENSDEQEYLSKGVLTLTSSRSQSYQMCWYRLKERFPAFLKQNLSEAIKALVYSTGTYIISRHVYPYLKEEYKDKYQEALEHFDFGGKKAAYYPDGSTTWDSSDTYYHDEQVEMINQLFEHLEDKFKQGDIKSFERAVDKLVEHSCMAVFWRRLLSLGAEYPKETAEVLFPLCTANPVLLHPETLHEVSLYLAKVTPQFTKEQMTQVESAILGLTGDNDKYIELCQRRLLSQIPEELLTNPLSKELLAGTPEDQKYVFSNTPLVRFERGSSEVTNNVYFEEILCRQHDVDPKQAENQECFELANALKDLKLDDKSATSEVCKRAGALLRTTIERIDQIDAEGKIHKTVSGYVWDQIAQTARAVISANRNDAESGEFKYCRDVIIRCANHWKPEADNDADEKFKSACWSPCPRNVAAETLPLIIAIEKMPDAVAWEAHKALLADPEPSVRWLAHAELWRVSGVYEDEMWELLAVRSAQEKNIVVREAIYYSANRSRHKAILSKCVVVYSNLCETEPSLETYDAAYHNFQRSIFDLWVHEQNEWAATKLEKWLGDCWNMAVPLASAVLRALEWLDPKNKAKQEVVERSVEFLGRALDAVKPILVEKNTALPDENPEKKADREKRFRMVYSVVDDIASRAYFDSGVYDPAERKGQREKTIHQSYFEATKPLIHQVADYCSETNIIHASTTNYLIEYLQGVAPFAPAECLSLALQIVKGSKSSGYHLDSIGVKNAVALVEVLLVDHKDILKTEQGMTDMLEFLDIFADVGWDEAIRLVWRLEEVFR